jgi:hypothetical protein
MAALLPTLECVAAPIPAPAAPPTVAPVRVPQPPATKLKSEIPRYHARICLLFIVLTSYQDVLRKTCSNTPRAAEKKAHGKVRTVGRLARLKGELAGLELLLRKNSTSVVDEIAEVTRSSNLHASVEVGTLYLQPRDTFAFVLGDAVSA